MVNREMVRRSRVEYFADILNVVEEGANKPSRIMFKTNLDWKPLQMILSILVTNGFIREERVKNSPRYYITDRGCNALYHYTKSLKGFIPPFIIS